MSHSKFTPIVLINQPNDVDRLAIKQVNSIYEDLRETMNTARSQQTKIGISEIGTDCDRCLARKLSGLYPKLPETTNSGWKAQVGTMGHAYLEEWFGDKYPMPPMFRQPTNVKNEPTDVAPYYFGERRLEVHKHKSLDLGGNCDLFIQGATFGLVVDWKFQGAPALKRTAANKLPAYYIVQMHTYGLGYELQGFNVTHVCLYALPRDGELWDAKPVLMPYDKSIAVNALARLDQMIDAAELLDRAYPGEGWERLIRAQERAGHCFDCPKYERLEGAETFSWIPSR